MTNKNCPICFGIGWVCENHPTRAWDEMLGCTCGAGDPCPVCNKPQEFEEPDFSYFIEDGQTKPH
jgi:hypothetical protein